MGLNIGLVSEFFPPYVTGGAEIFLNNLAEYLVSRGHNVVIITSDQKPKGKVEKKNQSNIGSSKMKIYNNTTTN